MTFEQIVKEIKSKKYRPIYFLDGQEPFFIDAISNLIEKSVLSEAEQSFNQIVLYGKDTDCTTIANTAARYPMMAPHQVVIVREAQQIRNITDLNSYVEQPNPSTILVIAYKYKKLDQRSKLAKSLKKGGHIYFHSKPLYDNQIPDWIGKYLKTKGKTIEPNAVMILAEYLGTQLSKIAKELDKLLLNLPKADSITAKDVEENIGISRDYNLFELQKALAYKDSNKTFRIIQYFEGNPKAAPMPLLMGTLYNFFSKLYIFHHFARGGDKQLMDAMGLRSNFFLKEYRAAARHYNLSKTTKNLGILLQYDLKSKGYEQANNNAPELIKEMAFRLMN